MSDFVPLDLLGNIQSYLLAQYKESANLTNYLKVLLEPFQLLEQVYADILNKRMLNNAVGEQLDVNGILVQLDRGIFNPTETLFFGMDSPEGLLPVEHTGFGDLNDSSVGGIFRSLDEPILGTSFLPDDIYKRAIRAKIIKNNYKGGYELLIEAVLTILDIPLTETGVVEILERNPGAGSDPFVIVRVHRNLDSTEKGLLRDQDLLPRGGGINFNYEDNNGSF